MVCDGCKLLADLSVSQPKKRHPNHLRKTKPHCDDPISCTCQHLPVGTLKREK